MKRASSLNVLNVGGKAAEDHFQVRSPAPPHALNSPDQAGRLAADLPGHLSRFRRALRTLLRFWLLGTTVTFRVCTDCTELRECSHVSILSILTTLKIA